jgi:hypothetical protein
VDRRRSGGAHEAGPGGIHTSSTSSHDLAITFRLPR